MQSKIRRALVLSLALATQGMADMSAGYFNPYMTTGARISVETVSPTVRKWYLPQALYHMYGWKNTEYTNYARENYERYVNILLEGTRFYDLYGNHITRGWRVYEWDQAHAQDSGSGIFKAPQFGSWFNRLLISSTSRGQFHTSLSVGEMLRTTLTPMTFSKPLFDGVQWDMISDKYAMTIIASRISATGTVALTVDDPLQSRSVFTNMVGGRGTMQLGDFLTLGATYINAGHWNSSLDMGKNSMRGTLGGRLNADHVRRLVVQLTDDSPEDGTGGTLLFRERLFINGVEHSEITPLIDGGVRRSGLLEVNGADAATLTYDIEGDFFPGAEDEITDYKEIRKIEVELVLANDYAVAVTSNMQTNNTNEPVFLPVARAMDNIQDGSNQRVLRFTYGLPTANEIMGVTAEITNVRGLNVRMEYDVNRRYRRFPNQSITRNQTLGKNSADAFSLTASQTSYPWFAYGEVFSMDADYNTSMFIPDSRGVVDYENEKAYLYEFVDDNDDQDRYPDWARRYEGGGTTDQYLKMADQEVFPGYDENHDLVSDFNQNDNDQPDYSEPFIRYEVDPLEFLFGMDMNNNAVIDRFENDTEADFPYKRDHRGYNAYGGAEIAPGTRAMVGLMREWELSSDRRSKSIYGLLTWAQDMPDHGLRLQFADFVRSVKDDISDDIILWVQSPFSGGGMQDVPDGLIARDAFVNTAYLEADYRRFAPLNLRSKVKYELYKQRGAAADLMRDQSLVAAVTKADYPIALGRGMTLQPKWKQLYLRQTPADRGELKTNDLSEIFFLVHQCALTNELGLESGIEYEISRNLVERPDPVPAGYEEDYEQFVVAAQFTNQSAYLGYRLVANIGGRWERKSFRKETETNTILFLKIFAGVQEY